MLKYLSLFSLALLAFMLPFELERPWLHTGPIVLTNVEMALGLVLALAFIRWQQQERMFLAVPKTWLFLGALFLVTSILTSLFAPEFRGNAMKAVLRTSSGLMLAVAVPQLVKTRRDLLWVAGALISGGVLATAVGLAESIYGSELAWLSLFRQAPTEVGPFIRLTGPFDFANQAAMFIEATLPLLLALGWSAYRKGRRLVAVACGLAALLYIEASLLTFSRSSFATILLATLVVAALLWTGAPLPQKRKSRVWFGTATVVVLLVVVSAALSPTFRLRFRSESDSSWYLADLDVPERLDMSTSETVQVPITLTNKGELMWRSQGKNPIFLAGRWVQLASEQEWAERPRWPLEQEVAPGETVTLLVPVETPKKKGEYKLVWDLIQNDKIWFGAKSGVTASSHVTVTGETNVEVDRESANIELVEATNYLPPIPGRITLWTIAWELIQEHPWLGIGLDNFRLAYGRALDYEKWDTSVHSNNWYVETLVSFGLVGSLPFFVWQALLALDLIRTLRRSSVTQWQIAVAAGLVAYFIHGLLDYFLLFNATALLFWLLVGSWLSQKSWTWSQNTYADRI
ncbi:MAG TPA: O-antigen ligase family protein [Anaerolineae bacterium]